jgi:predicted acylesterase/phospholipase RssA
MAAYEAGALAYALDTLPRELGQAPRIDIYAGTSGGAFNVSFLAASADDLGGAARRLAEFWRHVRLDELVRFGVSERAIGCSVSTNRSTPSSTAGPR